MYVNRYSLMIISVSACWLIGLIECGTSEAQEVATPLVAALSDSQLVEGLGNSTAGRDRALCVELGSRLRKAQPADQLRIVADFENVISSAASPSERRFAGIACLNATASNLTDYASRHSVEQFLTRLLTDTSDSKLVVVALDLMPKVATTRSGLNLIAQLLNDPKFAADQQIKAKALFNLGRFGPSAVPVLLQFLPDEPEQTMIALSQIRNPEAIRVLIQEASNPDAQRRSHAIHALGLIAESGGGDEKTRGEITKTLRLSVNDPDADVRNIAVESLSGVPK